MEIGIESFAAAYDDSTLAVSAPDRLRNQRSRRGGRVVPESRTSMRIACGTPRAPTS
jgi:hypothetical protein